MPTELVGREHELAALLTAVRSPVPAVQAVALVGEPGAGKSRLLDELATTSDANIVLGHAMDAADGGGPYRLLEALLPTASPLDEEAAFEGIADALAVRATQARVTLLLDDVQWAATTSCRALSHAIRVLSGAALTLVLSGRPEILEPGASVAQLLDELNRRRVLDVLWLKPLSADDVRRLARLLTGATLTGAAEARLVQAAGGNPFFVEELVRAGGELVEVPPTLRLAIAHRLDRLSTDSRGLLEVGAVLGRTFTAEQLSSITGAAGAEVLARLEQARRAEFISRASEGWTFRHDAVRETAYELAPGKAGLHLRAAAALAATAPDDAAGNASVATHFRLGGARPEAGAWSLRAASAALAGRAPVEARAHAHAAAELLADDSVLAAEARLVEGESAMAAGEFDSAERVLQTLVDGPSGAYALLHLGRLSRRREESQVAANRLEAALAAGDEGPVVTEALIELASLDGLARGRFEEAEANARRAIDLATAAGDARLEARALLALASTRARRAGPEGQADLLRSAMARAEAGGDMVTAAEAAATLANVHYWVGELGESARYAERRLELAIQAGDVFALRHTHSWLALLATSRGEWNEAERLAEAARPGLLRLQSPEPIAFLEVVEGLMWLRRGDPARAYAVLVAALARLEGTDPAAQVWYAGLAALAAVEDGRTGEAEPWIRTQEERLATMAPEALPARSARTVLALVFAALRDRERGAACEEALRPFADDFHWWPVRRSLAALAALRGDTRTALADLDATEALCAREGLQPDLHDIAEMRRRVRGRAHGNAAGLSRREVEVLTLVAAGCTNRDIAERLVLSERTVINHVTHILNKLGTDNRAGAAAAAMRLGIVQ